MVTLNNRVEKLEQKSNRSQNMEEWTTQELLDYIGYPDGATDEQLKAIAEGKLHHG
jgi:hypothetical protein